MFLVFIQGYITLIKLSEYHSQRNLAWLLLDKIKVASNDEKA
jgi:hypothetical protein